MNENAKQLISKSFLSGTNKAILSKILDSEGETEKFFEKFSELIMEELGKRAEKYSVLEKKLNGELKHAEAEFLKERKALDEWLNNQMTKIDATDFEASGKIFDEYYNKVSSLYKKQDEQMKQVFGKILISEM
jgi:hypothetical protein